MNRKAEYRKFLKTKFWKELSAKHKASKRLCERCKSREGLQSHHRFYRPDWFDTQIEDLELLCRKCHKREHGIITTPWLPLRTDERFNSYLHRIQCLNKRLFSTSQPLRLRDEAFLSLALKHYPPTKRDACMEFQVIQCRRNNALVKALNSSTK